MLLLRQLIILLLVQLTVMSCSKKKDDSGDGASAECGAGCEKTSQEIKQPGQQQTVGGVPSVKVPTLAEKRAAAKNLADCSALGAYWYDGSCHATVAVLNFNATLPLGGDAPIVGEHDVDALGVHFTHNADTVECSHDAGVTFTACDADDRMIFTAEDFNNDNSLVIKATKDAGLEVVTTSYTWQPSTLYTSLSIKTCDVTVTASETATEFQARLDAMNEDETICLASGVVIEGGDTPNIVLNHNVQIIGTLASADQPIFKNLYDNLEGASSCSYDAAKVLKASVFTATDKIVSLANLKAESVGCWGGTLRFFGTAVADPAGQYTLNNVNVKSTGEDSAALFLSSNTANGSKITVTVESSLLESYGDYQSNQLPAGLFVVGKSGNISITMLNTEVYSENSAASYFFGGILDAEKSIFESKLASALFVYSSGLNAVGLTFRESDIIFPSLGIELASSFSTTLDLSSVFFKANSLDTDAYAVKSPSGNVVNSSGNDNSACNMPGAQGLVSFFDGTQPGGTFDLSSQNGSDGLIGECP